MLRTADMIGSFRMSASAPLTTGGFVAPALTPAIWFSLEERNFRKWTVASGAFLPTAKPSPPPNASVGSPLPPSTTGKGNQPRSSPTPWPLVLLLFCTLGDH